MRLLRTEITSLKNSLMAIDVRQQSFLSCPFHMRPTYHFHPELELVYIMEGFGERIIGNKVEQFQPGDMVFIGSNVPHLWLSDPIFVEENLTSKAIVVYINSKIFLQMIHSIMEFSNIGEMIRQSAKGIHIFGETRNIVSKKLLRLTSLNEFKKVQELFEIMNMISISKDKVLIASKEVDHYQDFHSDKLIVIIEYIKEKLNTQISLSEIAGVACMTEQSFCRFFKKRMRKSFTQFVTELRIIKAKELLIQKDDGISDIAIFCGYNSSSHFCKVFKDQVGKSPLRFRSDLRECLP